jgi:hypothetical protein
VEGPAVQSIYKLFDASDRLRYVRFQSVHNYNKTSREAVYGWLDKYLAHVGDGSPVTEEPYTKDADDLLRVFPDNKLPDNAVSEQELINYLMQRTQRQLDKLTPRGTASLAEYKKVFLPAWERTMQLDIPETGVVAEFDEHSRVLDEVSGCSSSRVAVGRVGKGDRISAMVIYPQKANGNASVVLVHPKGIAAFVDASGAPTGLAKQFISAGVPVVAFDEFKPANSHRKVDLFFATYNKTTMQERVQDIVTVCAFARGSGKAPRKLVLIGEGEAGLAAMLAAPMVDAVVADCTSADNSDLFRVRPDIFVPGLRSVGDFTGVAALAAPHPVYLCADLKRFSGGSLRDVYKSLHARREFRWEYAWPKDEAVVKWVAVQK